MSRKQISFGVGAGIFSLVVDGLAGLLIYPLLLRVLDAERAGLWVICLAIATLLNAVQSSMSPAVSRRIAMLISKHGIGEKFDTQVAKIRYIYVLITAFLFIVGMVVYVTYLKDLFMDAGEGGISFSFTLMFFGSVAIACFSNHFFYVLNGLGLVGIDKVVRAASVLTGFIVACVLVIVTKKFEVLAVAYFVQALLLCLGALWSYRRHVGKEFFKISWGCFDKTLILDGSKILVLSMSAYLLNNFALFFAEQKYGLSFVPMFSALTKVGLLIATLSLLVPQMMFPFVSREWAQTNYLKVYKYYIMGVFASVGIFTLVGGGVFAFSSWFFPLWLGAENYLGTEMLALVLCYFLIYTHHVAQALPVLASGGSTFVVNALVNCVLVILAIILLEPAIGSTAIPIGMIVGTLGPSIYVVMTARRRFVVFGRVKN